MNLRIDRVVDHGLDNERVELSVTDDCNLHYYIIADTTYTDEHHISNKLRHMHWFATQQTKKGDKVILYTKKGKNSAEKVGTNTKYLYYWNLGSSVWNDEGDAALLFSISTWKTTKTK